MFSACKILLGITAGVIEFENCNLGIVLWVLLSTIFDGAFLVYNCVRIPVLRNIHRGDLLEEPKWSVVANRVIAVLYVLWIIPGNVLYWTMPCNGTFISGVALFFLICGYVYLLIPCLLVALFCLCLPVMFVYILTVMRRGGGP